VKLVCPMSDCGTSSGGCPKSGVSNSSTTTIQWYRYPCETLWQTCDTWQTKCHKKVGWRKLYGCIFLLTPYNPAGFDLTTQSARRHAETIPLDQAARAWLYFLGIFF
jgi:hypothetical protein